MKKILKIGGNDIAFECKAATPFYYKSEFRHDYFADMIKLAKSLKDAEDLDKLSYEDLDHVDLTVISHIAWACAKSADKDIKPFMDWIEDNPEFSIFDHGIEISQMAIDSMTTKKK